MTTPTSMPLGTLNLASARLGASVLQASDDFFAEKENLIMDKEPIWDADRYTDRGKWMDGWESRRKRTAGFDFVIIKLAHPGVLKQVDINTAFFLGNHPPFATLEGAFCWQDPDASTAWQPLLYRVPLAAGSHNTFTVEAQQPWTHVRLSIFPDGGVARLRLFGAVFRDPLQQSGGREIDLLAPEQGARVVAVSDEFFSAPQNLQRPDRGIDMSDGWETKRRRTPGFDWVVFALPQAARAQRLELDTAHFKGNYPDRFALHGTAANRIDWGLPAVPWQELLPETKLAADRLHSFDLPAGHEAFRYVRLSIFPDGGVSRLRLYGHHQDSHHKLSREELATACADISYSKAFADLLCQQVPFANAQDLLLKADAAWSSLPQDVQMAAIARHPQIGDLKALRQRFSRNEQRTCGGADSYILEGLAAGNASYRQRFGFQFVICAQGLPAPALLAALTERLARPKAQEQEAAQREHAKIIKLRLLSWLAAAC